MSHNQVLFKKNKMIYDFWTLNLYNITGNTHILHLWIIVLYLICICKYNVSIVTKMKIVYEN